MKGNIKGFTLVELLAVIVILGIVALVTTPAILNVINNARRSGAEDKAWGTIDAVRLAYTQAQSLDYADEISDQTYKVGFGSTNSGVNAVQEVNGRKVSVSGEVPSSGTVFIDTDNGQITAVNLVFTKNGTYHCTSNNEGTSMCCVSGSSAPDATECGKVKGYSGTLATATAPFKTS